MAVHTEDLADGSHIYEAAPATLNPHHSARRSRWQLGYTIVMWRGRHIIEPTELAAQEASGYWLEVLQVASALQRHYRPVKMNYQTLGNAVPHLHTHLVPRFAQDPAPGRPLPFPEGERPKLPEDTLRRDALALRALV